MKEVTAEMEERLRKAISGERGADQKRIAETGLTVIDTLLRKNHDYGSSAWTPPVLAPGIDPRQAIQVRMSDKVQRIGQLSQGEQAEVAESIEDSVGDLVGYGILWLGAES